MRLTIIGKYGPYPPKNAGTSCYLLQSEQAAFVLDCGSGALAGLQQFVRLSALDAVILSHLHYDHIADVLPYTYYLQSIGQTKPLYLPVSPRPQFDLLASAGVFALHPVTDGMTTRYKDLTFTFVKMPHPVESYAVKITDGKQTLVYGGDASFTDALIPLCKSADLALLDCGGFGVHMTLADAGKIADAAGVQILATHLHPEREYTVCHPRIRIAEEGQIYEVRGER